MNQVSDASRDVRFTALATDVWEPLQRYVRRRARPDDVDDIVAEALTVVWRRLDDVPAGAELPWAYSIARRCLANHRRSTTRRRGLIDRIADRRGATVDSPDAAAAAIDDTDPDLRSALARLSADDREVLTLWAWEQLAVSELAVVLGISPNTATVRLRRARQRLAAQLGESTGHIDDDAGHTDGGRTQEMPR